MDFWASFFVVASFCAHWRDLPEELPLLRLLHGNELTLVGGRNPQEFVERLCRSFA